ncbi:LacI family DNA-binding transcriptional regulator [Butyrivibrio sp. M55]|uniref:LacI family DNA-binding transcriptional regulator n=1 Tax=Butyrivibrio sp. M55 TaxID=1855323 RepID=UPI0008EB32AE|nr:LacI family DNA-binding transcriptional regulator [Butyrivibrio sp. M55]SFU38519.1 transcriptional regulator, LacI family [Butyrivibrio sp. M55]
MATKVTLQDIADALGVSRNTVSKAINNTGVLADSTRQKVLEKAIEMGYKQFSYASSVTDIKNPSFLQQKAAGEIALFTGSFLNNSHFASTMLDKFQHEISLFGYSLSMHRVDENNFNDMTLPISYRPENTKGIVCIEMFNHPYCEMLCQLDLPVLMIDAPVASYWKPLNADILLMDNSSSIFSVINDMSKKGITKIGFVGQVTHCRSFYERFMAFREALYINNLSFEEKYCLTEVHPHGLEYKEYLFKALEKLEELPEMFICANDFVAIDLIYGLRKLGIECPRDIKLFGFDDSPESKIMTPPLSTSHIHSQIIGYSAANMILSRIQQPDLNYRITYTETDLIVRESTVTEN